MLDKEPGEGSGCSTGVPRLGIGIGFELEDELAAPAWLALVKELPPRVGETDELEAADDDAEQKGAGWWVGLDRELAAGAVLPASAGAWVGPTGRLVPLLKLTRRSVGNRAGETAAPRGVVAAVAPRGVAKEEEEVAEGEREDAPEGGRASCD